VLRPVPLYTPPDTLPTGPEVDVFIGLGANVGDAVDAVRVALQGVAQLPFTRLRGQSSLYRSAPVDAQGPDFINAVAWLRSSLLPQPLLVALQQLENSAGRERPYRHAPRTLDLDILLHGSTVSAAPELTLPHPRMHLRRFVLEPLHELAPQLHLPGWGPLTGLLRNVADQTVQRLP
jgi:2-amino-4-hydroxy-6-hydroxymethyldihydropteridine diphosphokinase